MTKIILTSGDEKFVSPGEAQRIVAAGDAVFAQHVPMYSTRQMVAETPVKEKRKRRTKAEMEAENDAADIEKLKVCDESS